MRNLFSILLIICYFSAYAQDNTYKTELYRLEQKIQSISQYGLKIPVYKDIIKLSFPDHLEEVLKYSEVLLKLSEVLNNNDSRAFAIFYLAEYSFNTNDFEKAENQYKEALKLYTSLENTSQILQTYRNIGLVNQYITHYEEALSFYQKSIEIAQLTGSQEQAAICYHDIGTLYNDLQKYSIAQYYFEKALEIYTQTNNEEQIAAIYQNIGELQFNWGNFDQSLKYYQKSLLIYEELKDKQKIAISLTNIALLYEEYNNSNMALSYYKKACNIFEEINFKPTLVYVFYKLGSLYKNIGDFSESVKYLKKGLHLSTEISMKDYILFNYETLSEVYNEMGKYSVSLKYYKEFIDIKDSLFKVEKQMQIADLEAQLRTVQQGKEIEYLKLDQELKESKSKKKLIYELTLIFSSLLTLIIAFVIYVFFRVRKGLSEKLLYEIEEKKKTEIQLNRIKRELDKSTKERASEIEVINKKLLDEIEEHKKIIKNHEFVKNKADATERLKSNFLANLSYEVHTPMNTITGFSQLLADDNITSKKRSEYIDLVQEGCKSLTNLIDDIVDFVIIESGQAKIEKKVFNPNTILEFLKDHYTNKLVTLEKENIILSYANENKENDFFINTDPSRLKQILSILIDNAIKFTESGHVEFGFTHPCENEIQFFVRDTGIGIDEKYYYLIFESFRQIDASTTKKYNGAGIGLSVAKNLVELLNGKIFFESALGKGTTFFFKLPFKSNERVTDDLSHAKQFNWKDKVILVAEDQKINYELIKESLSLTNVNLIWAKNGEEALNFVEKNSKIDLVLMDIQMPIMDGYECAKRIKEMTYKIPILAQTAYALPQDSYKCFDAGCDDYISKPISINQFLIKLNKYLS